MATKLHLDLDATRGGNGGSFSWLFSPSAIAYYQTQGGYAIQPAAISPIWVYYGTNHNGVHYSHEATIASGTPATLRVLNPNKEYGYEINIQAHRWNIYASNQADSIFGANVSSDWIDAGGGSDTVKVDNSDIVYGGLGNDYITASDGNFIYSQVSNFSDPNGDSRFDNDTIIAQHKNYIDAGIGDDSIVAKSSDTIYAGDGNDQVHASDHSYIDAGKGDEDRKSVV